VHATGIYEGDNQACAADFFVSSYTPSLSTIIKSREDYIPIPRHEIRALIFGEPGAPGLSHIPKVEDEVNTVAGIMLSISASVPNDISTAPTVKSVLEQLPSAHVAHLACHGHQHTDPLQSCLALRDGMLSISPLMDLNLPNALFAYLSACETAKGDKDQPDQAVHLAASLLFCGFRSVVATMW
jgi:CHAT domain-containing protein